MTARKGFFDQFDSEIDRSRQAKATRSESVNAESL